MNVPPEIAKILTQLALPPGIIFLLLIVSFVLYIRNQAFAGKVLGLLSLTSLYILSTPIAASKLAGYIEPEGPLRIQEDTIAHNQAIVLLGCSRYANPLEYPHDDASACSLVRIRYAAELMAMTELPLLVSGGSVFNESLPEAEIISDILLKHFGIKADWLETQSRNTIENALFSQKLLEGNGIRNIILVTSAAHMKRASTIFRKTGLHVTEAPTYFIKSYPMHSVLLAITPSAHALYNTSSLLKELLGLLWFNFTYKFN